MYIYIYIFEFNILQNFAQIQKHVSIFFNFHQLFSSPTNFSSPSQVSVGALTLQTE